MLFLIRYGAAVLLAVVTAFWCIIQGLRRLYQRNKRAGMIAGWTAGGLALILCAGVVLHFQPYSRSSAWLFYRAHAQLLDTVAQAVLDDGKEGIPNEIEQVNHLFCRGASPYPHGDTLYGAPAVRFRIYRGDAQPSGDGSSIWPVQDLVYAPGADLEWGKTYGSYAVHVYRIAENWYLCDGYE